MFPLGRLTGKLQATREAEEDIYVLLHAVHLLADHMQHVQLKYVAVAVLAFSDMACSLGRDYMRRATKRSEVARETLATIRQAKQDFEEHRRNIEPALRAVVRNKVSAHREQQTIGSVSRVHDALRSPEFPAMFAAARHFVDCIEATPVWSWGTRTLDGVVAVRGSKIDFWQELPISPRGFSMRAHSGAGRMDWVSGEQRIFATERDAHLWAEAA